MLKNLNFNFTKCKFLKIALLILLIFETTFLIISEVRKVKWEVHLPRFCSTFDNGSCLLDYSETRESFIRRYEHYCSDSFTIGRNKKNCGGPQSKGMNAKQVVSNAANAEMSGVRMGAIGEDKSILSLCACVPEQVRTVQKNIYTDELLTRINNTDYENLKREQNHGNNLNNNHSNGNHDDDDYHQGYEVCSDGTRQPRECDSRHKTVIIIPYRGREKHLNIIIDVLHSFLQKQRLAYNIYVVEQNKPAIFNKAAIMNAGFLEIRKNDSGYGGGDNGVDCYIFHDVDMVPLDPANFYVCVDMPRHIGAFIEKFNYELLYQGLFGGVTGFKSQHFIEFNGFSNEYYGWGGEDDDILRRVKSVNMMVNRFPSVIGQYKMLTHQADKGNPGNRNRTSAYIFNPTHYPHDGLNTARYTVESIEIRRKYTHILISLLPTKSDPNVSNGFDEIFKDLFNYIILHPLVWLSAGLGFVVYNLYIRRRKLGVSLVKPGMSRTFPL